MGSEADDGAGGEIGADAELGVVSDEGSEELFSGGFVNAIEVHAYGAVGVFEVAGGGAGAEVGPFADDGLAEETVVLFVGVSEEEAMGDFTADAGVGAEGAVFANFCGGADEAVGADGSGAGDDGIGTDFGVLFHNDGAVLSIEDGTGPDFDAAGEVNVFLFEEVDAGENMGVVGGAEVKEIFEDGGALMVEEMPGAFDEGDVGLDALDVGEDGFEGVRVGKFGEVDFGGEFGGEVHPDDGGLGDAGGIDGGDFECGGSVGVGVEEEPAGVEEEDAILGGDAGIDGDMGTVADDIGESVADEDAGEGLVDIFLEALEKGHGADAEFAGGAGVGEGV